MAVRQCGSAAARPRSPLIVNKMRFGTGLGAASCALSVQNNPRIALLLRITPALAR